MPARLLIFCRSISLTLMCVCLCLLSGCEKTEKKDDTIPPGLSRKMIAQLEDRSIEALTDYITRRIDSDQNYYKRALLYFNRESYDRAMNDVNSALSHKDNVADYYLLRSKIFRETNKLDEALHDAQRAEALIQNNLDLYILLADILQERKEYHQASQYLNLALKMNPYDGRGVSLNYSLAIRLPHWSV
jgi:tetratricopeptide (TPR) repeat protein